MKSVIGLNSIIYRDAFARNKGGQATDKAPGEEKGKAEQVTDADLKGKKVDADPEEEQQKTEALEKEKSKERRL